MREYKKIAIVYDWIDKWGGVERVLLTLHEMFPHAQFYTSYYDPETANWAKNISIKTSFIQKLPSVIKKNRILSLLLYPFAFESFNFSSYDLVISITSSFAKSIITKPETTHLCYLLTPTRFLWSHKDQYMQGSIGKKIADLLRRYLEKWDLVASQRPDKIISLSNAVQKRCKKYYKQDSQVIYPPFDVEYWNKIKLQINNKYPLQGKQISKYKKYFLVVSRLEPYKKVDLVVQSFNLACRQAGRLSMNLIVVGKGSEDKKLRKMAKKNTQFIPYVSDEELVRLYLNAEALIMPQEEDFGYVSLEAQFFGCPVIAYGKGGAVETIVPNKTGLLFSAQNPSTLTRTLDQFHTISYNLKKNTQKLGPENVKQFDKKIFIRNFLTLVNSKVKS